MTDNWFVAVIEDSKGQKEYYQFESEEELRYFLSIHDNCVLVKMLQGGEH